MAVFLAYASRSGHTLIDRELHLPCCSPPGVPGTWNRYSAADGSTGWREYD